MNDSANNMTSTNFTIETSFFMILLLSFHLFKDLIPRSVSRKRVRRNFDDTETKLLECLADHCEGGQF